MNRIYLAGMIISYMITAIFAYILHENQRNIEALEKEKEQLAEEYSELQLGYSELQAENLEQSRLLEEGQAANEGLMKRLSEQRRTVPDGWQPFYGWWMSDRYYTGNKEGPQECWKEMVIHHNYIIFSDEDHITDEPVFDIAVRIRGDVIEELKRIGVEDESLIDMFQAECYAEMDFGSIQNWKREFLPAEIPLVENAKYYPIDNVTMLCISQGNGGRVYLFERLGY